MEFHIEKCPDCQQEMRAVVDSGKNRRLQKPYRQVCRCGRMVPLLSVADWISLIPQVRRQDAVIGAAHE